MNGRHGQIVLVIVIKGASPGRASATIPPQRLVVDHVKKLVWEHLMKVSVARMLLVQVNIWLRIVSKCQFRLIRVGLGNSELVWELV